MRVILTGLLPVDYVEPVVYIVGSQVIMLQIIGVLPDIYIEHGNQPHFQRGILVFGGDNTQPSCGVNHKPCIAGTKYGEC